jgi:transposase
VEIVAMDGFGGYKTAAVEALPDAVTVINPYHVVALAGHKLDLCRQRVQQETLGHRGRSGDPLYGVRRTLRTRLALLNDRQRSRIEAVFASEVHIAVVVTWWTYQQLIAAYAHPEPASGKTLLAAVIDRLRTAVPAGLEELAQLGRTLHRRRDDVLAYFEQTVQLVPRQPVSITGFNATSRDDFRSGLLVERCDEGRPLCLMGRPPSAAPPTREPEKRVGGVSRTRR